MFDLLAPLGNLARRTGLVRPACIAAGGALGVDVARHNMQHAPVVVFVAVGLVVVGAALRERGVAVAALGIATTAAFATPAGLGPLLVATGAVIGANPAWVDWRVAEWPEAVDAVIALPAVAGLASVAAAQPSERGDVVAAVAFVLIVATWWRGPRHGVVVPGRATAGSFLGVPAGAAIVLAPDRLGRLGVLPAATINTGRGVAASLGVFGVACLIQAVRTQRGPSAGATRRLQRGQHAVRRVSR